MNMTRLIASTAALGLASMFAHADLSPDESRSACLELGLTPESMTVLGLTSTDASALMNRVAESEVSINQLRTLQQQHRDARSSLKSAQKSVRLADTNAEASQISNEIDALEQQLETLAAQIEQLQDQIRDSALSGNFDPVLVEWVCEPVGLAAVVPPQYRVVSLIADDYAELLPALAAEQRAIANNEQLDNDTQLVLSRYRDLPAVLAVRAHMLLHIDAVRNVFNQE